MKVITNLNVGSEPHLLLSIVVRGEMRRTVGLRRRSEGGPGSSPHIRSTEAWPSCPLTRRLPGSRSSGCPTRNSRAGVHQNLACSDFFVFIFSIINKKEDLAEKETRDREPRFEMFPPSCLLGDEDA